MFKILWVDTIPKEMENYVASLLPDGFELETLKDQSFAQAAKQITDSDFLLVSGKLKISGDLLKQAGKLKLVQKIGAGYDTLDLDAIKDLGLMAARTSKANADAVAELTILLVLSLYRKLVYLDKRVRQGFWDKWPIRMDSFELAGKTFGIIGLGEIGKEVARRAAAFKCDIIYYQRNQLSEEEESQLKVNYVSLDYLLQNSDVISVHVPLTSSTAGYIGEREFKKMKRSAIIINTSRGGVIDENALYHALVSRSISGAGLDVFTREPTGQDNPLFALENTVVTPHIGGATSDTFTRAIKKSFANIIRVAEGGEPHPEDIIVT